MSDIKPEISTHNHQPSTIKFLIHIFFNFLSYLLFIRTMHECMVDYMLGLVFGLSIHLRVFYFYAPFLLFLGLLVCGHVVFKLCLL